MTVYRACTGVLSMSKWVLRLYIVKSDQIAPAAFSKAAYDHTSGPELVLQRGCLMNEVELFPDGCNFLVETYDQN